MRYNFLFQIIRNLNYNLSEDGSPIEINDRERSKKLWKCREDRILHSLVNLAFQQKVTPFLYF